MKAYLQAPINEQFNDSYGQSGLQPSTGGVSPVRGVTVEYKNDPTIRRGGRTVAGGSMQAAGTAVQYGGKAAKTAGRATMRAGAALSSTGVGAIAGVPLMAAGGAATAAGAGAEVAGKGVRQAGRGVRRASRLKRRRKYIPGSGKKAIVAAHGVASTARAARTTYAIWSWAFYIWIWFQVPIAVISLVAMGFQQTLFNIFNEETIAFNADEASWAARAGHTVTNAIGTFVKTVVEVVVGIFAKIFNIDPNIVGSLFMLTQLLVLIVGWFTLFAAIFIYKTGGVKPIFGENSGFKIMALLLAMVAYAIPFMNIFPWFFIWTLAVLKSAK